MLFCSQYVYALPLRLQDFSDPDTQLSVAGVVLGLVLGLGAPAWYINRTERDEERLEELRAMNRAQYQETGEYMSDVSDKTGARGKLEVDLDQLQGAAGPDLVAGLDWLHLYLQGRQGAHGCVQHS
jgi:hypothetical protein